MICFLRLFILCISGFNNYWCAFIFRKSSFLDKKKKEKKKTGKYRFCGNNFHGFRFVTITFSSVYFRVGFVFNSIHLKA